ncbi:unnamed protein product [Medioppia subpectinata]|uniref:Uncharacterized protein n=1 Tax=Medioppia subpectinata TaxID=1979941 RepID=A0A7R9KN37_9ACAR|nr:unnamed protein product [Medioppia subpectinata]CAG2105456.1 unnamed protein product [Medioppia subpectinata]
MKIKIKEEPIELKPCLPSSDDSSQPMDIESNSNSSVDYKDKEVKLENEMNEDNHDVDCWPTPPKPEMLTPERQTIECQKTSDELQCDDKSESNDFRDCIKQNESFLINKSFMRELKSDIIGDTIAADMRAKDNLQTDIEVKTEESDFSDVSSVHTSDLSDFDDEISLDDSNDESKDNKKNKISLKVVKKITEVLSNEQIGDQNVKSNQNASKQVSSDEQNIKTDIKSESKRIRKINPKYSSKEFSSIFTEKDVSLPTTSREEADESHNRPLKTQTESIHRMSSRRRRHSNCSESDGKESNELSANRSSKVAKRLEELPVESRCSSRGSIESSLSETTQDSTQSLNRPKRQPNKQRNESQGQRYDASDLYKPRRLMPSRRRGQTTPDSSTQSNEDFFIHDLSKQ